MLVMMVIMNDKNSTVDNNNKRSYYETNMIKKTCSVIPIIREAQTRSGAHKGKASCHYQEALDLSEYLWGEGEEG